MHIRSLVMISCIMGLGLGCVPGHIEDEAQGLAGEEGEEEDVGSAQLALMTESDLRIKNYTPSGLPAVGEPGRLGYVADRGLFVDSGSSWLGVGGEVFNVKAFGATGTGAGDDRPAIQAAVDAAHAAPHGGVVYFPAGEYNICNGSITLPRSYTKALTLRGDGPTISILRAGSSGVCTGSNAPLTSGQPVITFNSTANLTSVHYTFEGMQISRDTTGVVFYHWQPTLSEAWERLRYAVFRDLVFVAPDLAAAPVVHIQGAQFVRFENVVTDGGEVGIRMEDGSHVTMEDVRAPHSDHSSTNGIYIARGGSYSLSNIRINAVEGGSGLWLHDTQTISVNTVIFEGKRASKQIHLSGTTKDVVLINPAIATPFSTTTNAHGLYCGADTRNIQVIGGTMPDFTVASGGAALKVVSGARDISLQGVHMPLGEPTSPNVSIDSGVTRVKASFLYGTSADMRRVRSAGWFCTLNGTGTSESVRECEQGNVSSSVSRTVTTLTDGYEGQQIVLIFSDGNTTLGSGGNLKLASGSFAATADDTIRLIYNGTSWYELGRTAL